MEALFLSRRLLAARRHIALREAGLDFTLEKTDLRSKQTADGGDIRKDNPKGMVPTLVLDNGEVLTEGPAIVQWIADQKPASGLACRRLGRSRAIT